jgi:DNA-directed RNA polymerase subunit beta
LGEKIDAMLKEQRKTAEVRKFLESIYSSGEGRALKILLR